MNFGHKILITIILFVSFIISLVVWCVKQDDIQLVSENYYEKEILYQDEIEKIKNTRAYYSEIIKLDESNQNIQLRFASEKLEGAATGNIQLFRPSDADKDLLITIATNAESVQNINTSKLAKGLWKVKLDWSQGGKDFLEEQTIILQ